MNGRPTQRHPNLRRRLALASAAVMVGTLLPAVAQPIAAAADGTRAAPAAFEKPVAGTTAKVTPRTVMKGARTPAAPPDSKWPVASTSVVALPGTDAVGAKPALVPGLPLTLDTKVGSGAKPAHGGVETRVLSRAATRKAGVDGVLFTLRGKDTTSKGVPGQVRGSLDYSGFADAYGGGYASRLTLVELPACALTTPDKSGCRTAKPVKTVNDAEKQTLTAPAVTLRAAAPTVLAAVAATGSANGDYKASPLAASATWSTNLNTGNFSWSYNMAVPAVPGNRVPNVGLSYSSGSVDGRTGNTNNQASWTGDGFEMWPGYIERRYKPCADDGQQADDGVNKPGDLCWGYDNAYLSLNGKAGELVPDGTDTWKLQSDDGTKIERLSGTTRNNGARNDESWRVTAPDGTLYHFGYHRLPGWDEGKETTDSTWTTPVYGDDSGEPCHGATFADSWCQQGWRWNLDYVVDTHGNAVTYFYDKEDNHYGRNLEAEDGTPYVRGGTLDRIEYGLKSTSLYTAKPLAKVTFVNSERCLSNAQTTCSDIDTDAAHWYDTPWDLDCDSGEDCDQGRLSPSFFTTKRLTEVNTQVWDGSAYQPVDSWKLSHRWGMADTDYQLLLDSVQHTGRSTTPAITLPKTTFAYTQLTNRLDRTGDGYAPFIKGRLSTIADESGGQIDVNYSAPTCSFDALPTPQTNTTRCFPQYIGGSDSDDPERQWFNKYVVASVTGTDRTGKAPDQVTGYDYLGGAAWHYDDDDGLTKEKFKTWSQWRGYGQVRVQTGGQGGAGAMKTQKDTYFLRGMDGDRENASGGTKDVTVSLGAGEGDPITDHESAAGFTYKTATYSAPGGKILSKSVNRPWHHETAKKERDWGTVTANFTGTASSRTFASLDDGVGSTWRTTSAATTYDTATGRVTRTEDLGDDSLPDDNTCTRTTYATNTTKNILSLPARVESVAKGCDTTPSRPGDVISDVRSAYDGGAYGAEPTKGDTTATALLKKYDGTVAAYIESGATHDAYGRTLTSTDLSADVTVTGAGTVTRTPRTDGRTTTTVHAPATGFPASVKTTTPPAVATDTTTAQTSTTTHEGRRGLPLTKTDTNGKVTNLAYDALGRSTKVWLPDRLTGQTPTYEFTYSTTENKPVSVGTRTIAENGTQASSYVLYDGFLRPRQTQEPGPDGGALLADTFYDERGLVTKEFAPYYIEGAPSAGLFQPENALSVETQNRTAYDGLGRPVEAKQIAGNGDGGTVLNTTTTLYGGDRVTTIPPVGGTATTVLTDVRGQTTELRQHHSRSATAAYDTTAYRYTPRGEPAKVTDPAGNAWTYTYDLLGRRTTSTDPDKGTTVSQYDDRGQLLRADDARPGTGALWYTYDGLGRQTELREGSATGTLRATWVYDTISGAKGHLAESTRYHGGHAYTAKVVAYDRLYRQLRTSFTIPAVEGALQGTYLSGTTYNVSGTVQGTGYPKAGSLAAATVVYAYEDQTLRPIGMSGIQGLNSTTKYSLTGKPQSYELWNGASKKVIATNTYEWGTQRLATSRIDRQDIAGVDQYNTYRYDEVGNILSVSDTSRSGTDTQCFAYDGLRRLTDAWTQTLTSCSSAPNGVALGGPAPYRNSYTYDKLGQRLTETVHDIGGDTAKDIRRTYTYPAALSSQPHALTSVATAGPSGTSQDTYTYDETGNTVTRTQGGDTQELTWDAEGHLAKVTEPVEGSADKVTEYLYDTEGNRLIGRTPTETTLYLGSTEVTLAKGATTTKGTRYVDLGGGHRAVQQNDGSVSITLADHHGTAQIAINTGTQALTQRRTLPFGGVRGTEPTSWPGTKGFVGGTDDTRTTGLTHLGAREYDPVTGRFISVDPLLETDKPQTLNGYTYAAQNPLAFTDPTGLGLACGSGGDGCPDDGDPMPEGPKSDGNGLNYGDKPGSDGPAPTGGGSGNLGEEIGYDFNEDGLISFWPGINVPANWKNAQSYIAAFYQKMDYLCESGRETCGDPAFALFSSNTNGAKGEACRAVFGKNCTGRFKQLGWGMGAQMLAGLEAAAMGGEGPAGGGPFLPRWGSSRCAGNSFTADTKVVLADGTVKRIEDVRIGDKVLATDPKTGKTYSKKVTAEIKGKGTKNLVKVTIDTDGKKGTRTASVTATDGHPFWVPELNVWITATALKPGQWLKTRAGTDVRITALKRWTQQAPVYNLTVADVHTYYVLAGQTPVLVHNCNKNQGVYEFPDQWNPGKTYVGKTLNFKNRLKDHLDSGRLKSLDDVKCTHVCGTEDDVFIAEHLRMEELKRQGVQLGNDLTSPGKKKLQQRGFQQLELW
ncbi:polymorphic toxin-type HINT domain-containing protein [Streptomyces sp. NBC_01498]|uniref:polymorphic toxin-type HINT domain-containing protein n=1 Tax=Streptomyces sp. NBC_01498 TaxID=2975870 RepID=UPI002E7B10A9|nr:polymorphic toxin-type HINT domain-containing protein [Streptomyces sp. NBC_01498]WTL25193.1 polymorphic toxin-type HINT domain-containing protein [Streptomyces sp. NBC_01498]